MDKASLASSIANPCPTHNRGPMPNGKKASPPLILLANLSGRNSCASSPHILRSWCSTSVEICICMPLGRRTLPTLQSCATVLDMPSTGGRPKIVKASISLGSDNKHS
ncbi:hypothetical protein IEQ34_003807 [Dendrobium chrysotoxum]|uniref:Uncharacterized protein n=1 Tax=Dendrobium chrysotoxum TaxID=161865 RepID=A0AAV7HEQ2_DENCH|nr:hypothetical protein IEQ34_003807 [Dendrobium chrysotoxum]